MIILELTLMQLYYLTTAAYSGIFISLASSLSFRISFYLQVFILGHLSSRKLLFIKELILGVEVKVLIIFIGPIRVYITYLGKAVVKPIRYQSFALWSKDQHKSSFSKTTLLLLCKGSICASTYSYFSMYSKHLKVSSECQHADIFSCRYADIIVHNQQHF